MEKEFVPFELAVKLKELGFDKECFGVYYNKDGFIRLKQDNEIGNTPLWQQVFDWFREKHNLHFEIFQTPASSHWNMCVYDLSSRFKTENTFYNFISYEEAKLECMKKLIEIVKN